MQTIQNYGRFDEKLGCFEITADPPKKWRNLHYNQWGPEEYYAEFTHVGDGASRYRDAAGNTVNVIGYDCKHLHIRDDDTIPATVSEGHASAWPLGKADGRAEARPSSRDTALVFNPAGMPVSTAVTDRVIRIFPAKTEIASTCAELRVTARYFVPKTECVEVWTTFLENLSDRPRRVSVFAYAMFALDGSDREGRGFWKDVYSEVHPEIGGTLIVNRMFNCPTPKNNGFAIALNHLRGANGYRDQFTRADYSLAAPKILWGWNCDNQGDYGPDCAGVVQAALTIPPRGTERVDFVLGPCTGLDEVKAIKARLTPAKLDQMCDEQMAGTGKGVIFHSRPFPASLAGAGSIPGPVASPDGPPTSPCRRAGPG